MAAKGVPGQEPSQQHYYEKFSEYKIGPQEAPPSQEPEQPESRNQRRISP